MTLDQIFMLLTDRKKLRRKDRGTARTQSEQPVAAVGRQDADGMVKGRAEDGTPIRGRMGAGGKSVARQLMEAEAAKRRKK